MTRSSEEHEGATSPPAHVTTLRVRYGETDQMGIVHHANYLGYFEVGRIEMMRDCGLSYAELERDGLRLPVIEVHVEFRAPARYDDVLLLQTRLTRASGARLRFDYELFHEASGRVLATGHTMLAAVDGSGRPRRLPAVVVGALMGG